MSDEHRSVQDIVEAIDRKLDAKSDADEARFLSLEALGRDHEHRLDGHDEKHRENDERHRTYDRQMHDQAALLVTLGQATARAMDSATKAQQDSARTKDECVTIVESAIRMHSASISATVQDAVRSAVSPLVQKTEAQDKILEGQNTTLAAQDTKLDTIVTGVKRIATAIGHPHLRLLIVLCIALGSVGGAAYAGYEAVIATTTPTKAHQ